MVEKKQSASFFSWSEEGKYLVMFVALAWMALFVSWFEHCLCSHGNIAIWSSASPILSLADGQQGWFFHFLVNFVPSHQHSSFLIAYLLRAHPSCLLFFDQEIDMSRSLKNSNYVYLVKTCWKEGSLKAWKLVRRVFRKRR